MLSKSLSRRRFFGTAGRIRAFVRCSLTLLLSLAVLFGGATVASAAQEDPIAEALSRVANDTWTDADLDLIRSDPELAGQVADPKAPVETGVDASEKEEATTSAICGAWVDVWYRKRSLLGSTLYVWHHRVVYCRDGARVTRWQNRYDYITDSQSVVYVRGLQVNQAGAVPAASSWSHLQRIVELCVVKYGCYSTYKPHSLITVRGNGTYTYSGANG
ncbi:hypothetical protein [Nonomuraea zeae]|uniref:Uncharacterized protein n=1 Tax=Nonomuraea zeae TaxID=1642303 RepID=A0A5S4FLV3_9ACTN|nr:hypothetical protein [Nonomuraea zeae]TMR21191.1 hypothetical protein ETD85_51305 [Nonomuraea zeae]